MQLLVQDIVYLSMSACGATRLNESPFPYELQRGIQIANLMIDEWSGEGLMVRTKVTESFPLTAGQGSYTIGIGGNFNTSRPIDIIDAYVRDNYGIDTPVDIVSQDMWDAYPDKSISDARPIALYYDPGLAQQTTFFGTINLYYTPDSATPYILFINSQKYLTEFVNPMDVVTFEPLYYAALVRNLTLYLFRHFHGPKVPVPVDIEMAASDSKRIIQSLNAKRVMAAMDIPGKSVGLYDIYTGPNSEY